MTAPFIRTPRGFVTTGRNGRAKLVWNTKFQPKWQKRYTKAQIFIDSEVLRLCEPFTPLLTGVMIKTGDLGTKVGSGVVSWIAPYSAAQYYMKRKNPSKTGPLRGPWWFERMKAIFKSAIIRGAAKYAKGEL